MRIPWKPWLSLELYSRREARTLLLSHFAHIDLERKVCLNLGLTPLSHCHGDTLELLTSYLCKTQQTTLTCNKMENPLAAMCNGADHKRDL